MRGLIEIEKPCALVNLFKLDLCRQNIKKHQLVGRLIIFRNQCFQEYLKTILPITVTI